MAELMYLPEVAAAPPVNVRVKFWDISNWDPYESRTDNGLHVVKNGSHAGVYLSDGTQLILLNYLPAEEAADFGNLVLRSLVTEGFTDGLYLPDELRSGDRRTVQPGRCLNFNGTNQYVTLPSNAAALAHAVCEAWVYVPAGSANYKTIFSHEIGGDVTVSIQSWTTVPYFNIYNTGGQSTGTAPSVSVGWHHFVWRINRTLTASTLLDLWVDGVKQTLTYSASTGTVKTAFSTGPWAIGAVTFTPSSLHNDKISAPRIIHPAAAWSDAACALLYTQRAAPVNYADTFCWLKLDQDYSVSIKDSSGNNNHGLLINPVFNTSCFYQGVDVPYSFHNQVGWSKANTSPNLNTDVAGSKGWVAAGTTPPTVSAGTYFGKYARATTFTSASNTGYAGSRAQYNSAACSQTNGVRYRQSHSMRASRNLVGGEVVVVYWTGGQGHSEMALTSSHDLTNQWLEIVMPDNLATNTGSEYPVVYLGATVASDITFYLADDAFFVDYGNPVPRKESTPTLDLIGNPLQFKKKCPILPKKKQSYCATFNGSNQYTSSGVGVWSTDGTLPMEFRFRVKLASNSNSPIVIAQTNGAGNLGFYLQFLNTGPFRFFLAGGAGNNIDVRTTQFFPPGAWYDVKVTYDGSKQASGVVVTVDGSICPFTTVSNTLTGDTSTAGELSLLGMANWNNGFVNGSLADVNITIGKKWWRYKCSSGLPSTMLLDSGPFANHGTLVNYADSMWGTKQDVVHLNLTEGFRRGVNLLKYSEQFDNAYWGKANATITANSTSAPDGTSTADTLTNSATAGVNYHYASAPLVLLTGQTCTFSCYAKANVGSGWAVLHLAGAGPHHYAYFDLVNGALGSLVSWDSSTITAVGNGWYRLTATKSLGNDTTLFLVDLANANGGVLWDAAGVANTQQIYVWGAQVELGSVATPYHATRDIPGTCYTPRRDAVNMLRYSEQFGNTSAWGGSAASVVSNAAVAPDGTLTADKLVEDNTLAYHYVLHTDLDLQASTYAVMSCYAKPAEKSHVMLTLRDRAGSYWQKSFNIATGSIDPGFSGLTATIESVGNGWYRCSILVPVGTGANSQRCRIYLMNDAGNDANYTGNGTSGVYIWGAQVEYGTVPTTYAKTEDMPGPPGYKLSLLDALGLPLTHPAGEWHNFAETLIDFTAGQPLAPEFRGSSPPTAYAAGTTVSGLSKQSLTNKERKYELVKV